jgi:hypothetical protein
MLYAATGGGCRPGKRMMHREGLLKKEGIKGCVHKHHGCGDGVERILQ